ncbi:hypothetical protein H2203_004228 [Taxawa tesnikishii (nom. ined.)]|nr:hypothetical protein H2203_004228 [Dothideales sp. JES 119]
MAQHDNSDGDADFAKALQELAKGERTAAALENHLTNLEARIEELLAQANRNQADVEQAKKKEADQGSSSGNDAANTEQKP